MPNVKRRTRDEVHLEPSISFAGPARIKFPMYVEKEKCIPFDAGLLNRIKRQMIIRVHWKNVIYTYETDLDVLRKLADGHRHRVTTGHFRVSLSLIWSFFSTFSSFSHLKRMLRWFFDTKVNRWVPSETIAAKSISFQTHRDAQSSIRIKRPVQIALPNVDNKFTNISATNSFRKRSKHRPSVRSVRNFSGKTSPKRLFFLVDWLRSRGFAYQGFQCQRCDCVVHRSCYSRYACPCHGKKYTEVNLFLSRSLELSSSTFSVSQRRNRASFRTATVLIETAILWSLWKFHSARTRP